MSLLFSCLPWGPEKAAVPAVPIVSAAPHVTRATWLRAVGSARIAATRGAPEIRSSPALCPHTELQRPAENPEQFAALVRPIPTGAVSKLFTLNASNRPQSFRKEAEWHEIPEVMLSPKNPTYFTNPGTCFQNYELTLSQGLNKELHHTKIHKCCGISQPYSQW